jgi:hypothetical protein
MPEDPEAEEVHFPVRVRVANEDGRLRPGMKAQVMLP